jgi:type II secretory pathway pseudopilin PulG
MSLLGGNSNRGGFAITDFLVVIAIIGVLIAVAAPNALGYVSYETQDIDSENALKIENAVLRSVAEGKLRLGPDLKQTILESEVKKRMEGRIPFCQRVGFNFFVDRDTGKVSVKETPGEQDVRISIETLAQAMGS